MYAFFMRTCLITGITPSILLTGAKCYMARWAQMALKPFIFPIFATLQAAHTFVVIYMHQAVVVYFS